jgi:hypothetical protein
MKAGSLERDESGGAALENLFGNLCAVAERRLKTRAQGIQASLRDATGINA